MASSALCDSATRLMATLNRDAAGIMSRFDVHACTDVTGFGLLGHLSEMVSGSGMSVRLYSVRVPVIQEALEFAAMGLIPAGAYKNRAFRENMVEFAEGIERNRRDILFDPQTSGGLLIGINPNQIADLVAALKDNGIIEAVCIGDVLDRNEEKIWVV
jgi:selenide, water dikinase